MGGEAVAADYAIDPTPAMWTEDELMWVGFEQPVRRLIKALDLTDERDHDIAWSERASLSTKVTVWKLWAAVNTDQVTDEYLRPFRRHADSDVCEDHPPYYHYCGDYIADKYGPLNPPRRRITWSNLGIVWNKSGAWPNSRGVAYTVAVIGNGRDETVFVDSLVRDHSPRELHTDTFTDVLLKFLIFVRMELMGYPWSWRPDTADGLDRALESARSPATVALRRTIMEALVPTGQTLTETTDELLRRAMSYNFAQMRSRVRRLRVDQTEEGRTLHDQQAAMVVSGLGCKPSTGTMATVMGTAIAASTLPVFVVVRRASSKKNKERLRIEQTLLGRWKAAVCLCFGVKDLSPETMDNWFDRTRATNGTIRYRLVLQVPIPPDAQCRVSLDLFVVPHRVAMKNPSMINMQVDAYNDRRWRWRSRAACIPVGVVPNDCMIVDPRGGKLWIRGKSVWIVMSLSYDNTQLPA